MTQPVPTLAQRNHLVFWAGTAAAVAAFVWLFSGVLLPFVLGMAIAYLLNPLVNAFGRMKIPRGAAALIILGMFFAALALLVALAAPPLYRQGAELAAALPGWIDRAAAALRPWTAWLHDRLDNGGLTPLQDALKDNAGKALSLTGGLLGGIAGGGQAVAGALSVFLFTPITAYFMMKEWDGLLRWADGLIPRKHHDTVCTLMTQIDAKLAGFVRGQLTVAAVLGVVYALALTLAGLKFGVLIGLAAGALSIIPLVGSTAGLLASVAVAWLQSGAWGYTGMIAAIFVVGQIVEGHFLTPRLLGESVGLHPLWILFALMAGGSLLGITGMLLAVPVAAVAGVLIGFFIAQYRESAYFGENGK